VDVTLASLAEYSGRRTIAVILTGMGSDGTNGAALVRTAGGTVLVEDQSSCVVWGMPRSIEEAGLANRVVPLEQMAAAISQAVYASMER
jgi:two-component system chemotaxis response regulator CheB